MKTLRASDTLGPKQNRPEGGTFEIAFDGAAGKTSPERDDGRDMQDRLAKVESDIEYIKRDVGELKTDVREIRSHQERDFRLLFGAIIAATAGLAALMARGFQWIQ